MGNMWKRIVTLLTVFIIAAVQGTTTSVCGRVKPPWGDGPLPLPVPLEEARQAEIDSGWLWYVISRDNNYNVASRPFYRDGVPAMILTSSGKDQNKLFNTTHVWLCQATVPNPEYIDWVGAGEEKQNHDSWRIEFITTISLDAGNTNFKVVQIQNRLVIACNNFEKEHIVLAVEPDPKSDSREWKKRKLNFPVNGHYLEMIEVDGRPMLVFASGNGVSVAHSSIPHPTWENDFLVSTAFETPAGTRHPHVKDAAVIDGHPALLVSTDISKPGTMWYLQAKTSTPESPDDWHQCEIPGGSFLLEHDNLPLVVFSTIGPWYSGLKNNWIYLLRPKHPFPESSGDWDICPVRNRDGDHLKDVALVDGKPAMALAKGTGAEHDRINYCYSDVRKPDSPSDWHTSCVGGIPSQRSRVFLADNGDFPVLVGEIVPPLWHWRRSNDETYGWRKFGIMLFTPSREGGLDGPGWQRPIPPEPPPVETPRIKEK